ncbi:hypothetical protein K1719_045326 [Acacia pycnantha]|nr:hypothetical protein K1719_045326 [Acacia pycnantha]
MFLANVTIPITLLFAFFFLYRVSFLLLKQRKLHHQKPPPPPGQVPAIVISSSEAAQLILKTNDIVFAIRPRTQASGILTHGFKGVAFAD